MMQPHSKFSVAWWIVLALGGEAAAQTSEAALAQLETRLGPGLRLVRSAGDELELRGACRAWPALRSENMESAARDVLVAARELLGVESQQLALTREVDVAGLHFVQFEQRIDGVPVRGSSVSLELSVDGVLSGLSARGLSSAAQRESFVVTREDASELARLGATGIGPERAWAGGARRELLVAGDELRPVWSVEVWDPARPGADWRVTIDAVDGRLREARPTTVEALGGFVDGIGMANGPQVPGASVSLPMANIQVSAVERSIALLRITSNACGDGQVAMSSDASKVTWISTCDGDGELWVASSDGTGALQLTSNSSNESSPTISSDGSRIVFVSDADGDDELWSIQSDGTGLSQLTFNSAREAAPSLSGDGERVAYISDVDGDDELYTLLTATPTPVRLTFDTTRDAAPRLALDGSRIVWVSWRDGDAEICTITPAGTEFAQVTINAVEDGQPDITSDGSSVVFTSRLAPDVATSGDPSAGGFTLPSIESARHLRPNRDLFEAAFDGAGLRRVTHSDADEYAPSYATAGGCIAYVTDDGGDSEIEILSLAGGPVMRLTDNSGADRAPSVAASCGRGAWVSNDGDNEIFVWNLTLPGASALGFADSVGSYSLPFPDGATPAVETRLRGRYVRVSDLDPRWGEERATLSTTTPTSSANLLLNPGGTVEGPTAQVSAYYHANAAHDALRTILTRAPLSLPSPLPIDIPLDVRANNPDPIANAFYSSLRREASFFVRGGPLRPNTAYDTVVLHEYGHFFDDMHGGMTGGSSCEASGALSEGIADALAQAVSNQPIIGEDFFGPGTAIRDYGAFEWDLAAGVMGQQYDCATCTVVAGKPEIHEHGAAFAGFAWDLRAAVGGVTAEDLLFGALVGNPTDMQGAVAAVFALAATPAFGGAGDPMTSPLSPAICGAAARHGFDCITLPDQGSIGCVLSLCAASARHRSIGTEWLGLSYDGELACEPPPQLDDDGLVVPSPLMSGETKLFALKLSVAPTMKASGRYGAPVGEGPQLPQRRVYVNAWMFVDNAAGGWTMTKVLGTGSTSPTAGPNNISGGNTLAFNPDTWLGTSLTFPVTIVMPVVTTPRLTILRVRVDYGENGGAISSCLSSPSYDGACGIARFGEVEDFQTILAP